MPRRLAEVTFTLIMCACSNAPTTQAGAGSGGGNASVGGTANNGGSSVAAGGNTNGGSGTAGTGGRGTGMGGSTYGGSGTGGMGGSSSSTTSAGGSSSVGGSSVTAAGGTDVIGHPGSPYTFPQNYRSPNCIYPSSAHSADAQATYATWKSNLVTTDGAGGFQRVLRPDNENNATNTTVSEGIGYGMISGRRDGRAAVVR